LMWSGICMGRLYDRKSRKRLENSRWWGEKVEKGVSLKGQAITIGDDEAEGGRLCGRWDGKMYKSEVVGLAGG